MDFREKQFFIKQRIIYLAIISHINFIIIFQKSVDNFNVLW